MLASADLFVPSAPEAYAHIQPILGLYEPRGAWLQEWPAWGFDARWCRVNLDLTVAPTHLEIIAPLSAPDPSTGHPGLQEVYDAQGSRAYKTHSTPVATDDIEGLVRRLTDAGATFRLDEPEAPLDFHRLWLGRDADRPGEYDPAADGGLYLEFIPAMGFPVPGPGALPVAPPPDHPAVRIARRTMIVPDLEDSLRTLDTHLGWEPAGPVERRADGTYATFGFAHPGSAVLEVVQPTDADSLVGRYAGEWGPGPYGMTIEVGDLEAVPARLAELGVGHLDTVDEGGRVIMPSHRETFGAQLVLRGRAQQGVR